MTLPPTGQKRRALSASSRFLARRAVCPVPFTARFSNSVRISSETERRIYHLPLVFAKSGQVMSRDPGQPQPIQSSLSINSRDVGYVNCLDMQLGVFTFVTPAFPRGLPLPYPGTQ